MTIDRVYLQQRVFELLALQIRLLRENRGWSQAELAERAGLSCRAVQYAEDAVVGRVSVRTLKKIATAFDVALILRFTSWSDLLRWLAVIDAWLATPSYEEEKP